jgi:hypothetical protein
VTSVPPDHQRWLVQPLIDAGLVEDEVRDLLFRLAFEAIVDDRPDGAPTLADLARDKAPSVHQAWIGVLDRMLGDRETTQDAG